MGWLVFLSLWCTRIVVISAQSASDSSTTTTTEAPPDVVCTSWSLTNGTDNFQIKEEPFLWAEGGAILIANGAALLTTMDDGATWKSSTLSGSPNALFFEKETHRLYYSRPNEGALWILDMEKERRSPEVSELLVNFTKISDDYNPVNCIHGANNILYVATGRQKSGKWVGGMLSSRDGGENWALVGGGDKAMLSVYAQPLDGKRIQPVYASGKSSKWGNKKPLLASFDNGKSFSASTAAPGEVFSLPRVGFMVNSDVDGIVRTVDTWDSTTSLKPGAGLPQLAPATYTAIHGGRNFAFATSTPRPATGGDDRGSTGVLASFDKGVHWEIMETPAGVVGQAGRLWFDTETDTLYAAWNVSEQLWKVFQSTCPDPSRVTTTAMPDATTSSGGRSVKCQSVFVTQRLLGILAATVITLWPAGGRS